MPLLSPTDPLPPTYRRDKEALWRDIRALWKALHGARTPLSNEDPMPVDYEADPGSGDEAARWDHVHQGAKLNNEVMFAYDSMTV